MTVWYTSDQHWGHFNIIQHSHRPFTTVEQMNEVMIQRWNEKVQPGDLVYNLGDIFYKMKQSEAYAIRERLNGDICLINGNHDKIARNMTRAFKWIRDTHFVMDEDPTYQFFLCHYPMRSWNGSFKGSANLFGHCHGNLPVDHNLRQMDLGVDVHNFYPLSTEDVVDYLKKHNLGWKRDSIRV